MDRMDIRLALATLVDSRTDFLQKRIQLVEEEQREINWLHQEFSPIASGILNSASQVSQFAEEVVRYGARMLIIHIPIWADPILTIKLANRLNVPIMVMGNSRPETSSIVGLLGAGGALDQIGRQHIRMFDHQAPESRSMIRAFIRAAAAYSQLRGQTLGLFGGRSLGIFTAVADPAQWQRLFGVDIETIDQMEIMQAAEAIPDEEVAIHVEWFKKKIGAIHFRDNFTPLALERQIRSYVSTRGLAQQYGFDFIGVKCQPELSDGYVTQCVSHLLMNGNVDAGGPKDIVIHACESDADGALSMHILHLLSGGKPAALLDIRWFDPEKGIWTLANCGAIPAGFCATEEDPTGLSKTRIEPHVFGKGGGGALPTVCSPQEVTLARLCRKNGEYWMAIVVGATQALNGSDINRATPAFPKAFVKSSAGVDFLHAFGSNHIHMVSGNYSEEIIAFCQLVGIPWQIWK
jgi:L-fucose/D-arabinose isomerase